MSEATVEHVMREIAVAWNVGDGIRLAAVFAVDATMIDVRGRVLQGREAIGEEHQRLFDTVLKGSTFQIELLGFRNLGDDLDVAHTGSVAQVPAGARAGENRGIQTLLIRRGEVVAFQNTPCLE